MFEIYMPTYTVIYTSHHIHPSNYQPTKKKKNPDDFMNKNR